MGWLDAFAGQIRDSKAQRDKQAQMNAAAQQRAQQQMLEMLKAGMVPKGGMMPQIQPQVTPHRGAAPGAGILDRMGYATDLSPAIAPVVQTPEYELSPWKQKEHEASIAQMEAETEGTEQDTEGKKINNELDRTWGAFEREQGYAQGELSIETQRFILERDRELLAANLGKINKETNLLEIQANQIDAAMKEDERLRPIKDRLMQLQLKAENIKITRAGNAVMELSDGRIVILRPNANGRFEIKEITDLAPPGATMAEQYEKQMDEYGRIASLMTKVDEGLAKEMIKNLTDMHLDLQALRIAEDDPSREDKTIVIDEGEKVGELPMHLRPIPEDAGKKKIPTLNPNPYLPR